MGLGGFRIKKTIMNMEASYRIPVLFAFVLLLGSPLSFAAGSLREEDEHVSHHEVSGSVLTPGMVNAVVKLYTADGREMQAFPELDGAFTFRDVPPGSHLLQPFCTTYFYPEVRSLACHSSCRMRFFTALFSERPCR